MMMERPCLLNTMFHAYLTTISLHMMNLCITVGHIDTRSFITIALYAPPHDDYWGTPCILQYHVDLSHTNLITISLDDEFFEWMLVKSLQSISIYNHTLYVPVMMTGKYLASFVSHYHVSPLTWPPFMPGIVSWPAQMTCKFIICFSIQRTTVL